MAKKKGQGTRKNGGRASSAAASQVQAGPSSQSKTVPGQLNANKTTSKSDSPVLAVMKGKAARPDHSPTGKNETHKESMSKEKGKEAAKRSLPESLSHFIQFLKEVNVERRKISWPHRDQVLRETLSVLFLVALMTLLVLGFDWILGHIFGLLEHFARLHGGGIGRN